MKESIKEYFRWHTKEKKPFYDWSEIRADMKRRKEKRFQNLCLNVYYKLRYYTTWIREPYILKGNMQRFWQRQTRGWDDSDCWSLDTTIAKFTLPRLKLLKEKMHGYPCEFANLGDDEGPKKWDETLDEMIFAMDYIANSRESEYFPDHEHDVDFKWTKEELKIHQDVEERVQKGCELFGKYFRSLWD